MNDKLLHEILTKVLNINNIGKHRVNISFECHCQMLDVYVVVFTGYGQDTRVNHIGRSVKFSDTQALDRVSEKLGELLHE